VNLAPILSSKRKVAISTLISSDISCIMLFLSDDAARVLEFIQRVGSFSDESRIYGLKRFEPRSQFAVGTEPNPSPSPNPNFLLTPKTLTPNSPNPNPTKVS
jgi:hypothetical protein